MVEWRHSLFGTDVSRINFEICFNADLFNGILPQILHDDESQSLGARIVADS
jgi:lantibiotic modifying enzyme